MAEMAETAEMAVEFDLNTWEEEAFHAKQLYAALATFQFCHI